MAVKAKQSESSHDRPRAGRGHEVLGVVLLALGLFCGLSVAAMHIGNPAMMGPGGNAAATGLDALLGLGGHLLIVALLVASWRAFRGRPLVDGFLEGTGAVGLLASVTGLLHLAGSGHARSGGGGFGGLAGQWLAGIAVGFVGTIGALLAATTLLFVSLLLVTDIRLHEVAVVCVWAARQLLRGAWASMRAVARFVAAMFPRRDEELAAADELEPGRRSALAAHAGDGDRDEEDARVRRPRTRRALEAAIPVDLGRQDTDAIRIGDARGLARDADRQRMAMAGIVAEVAAVESVPGAAPREPSHDEDGDGEVMGPLGPLGSPGSPGSPGETGSFDGDEEPAEALVIAEAPAGLGGDTSSDDGASEAPIIVEPAWRARMREREQAREDARAGNAADPSSHAPSFIKLRDGAFALPATSLLEYLPPQGNDTDRQSLYEMAERLEQAMANYGVRGKVKEIHMGPVVTMFEFAPAPGTRTGKIANLEKDLAMALEAQAVRIVAPIPGKAVVGVEVPNRVREMVYLREILEDDCFTKATSKLQLALGKDIKGAPVSVNLAKMPHLLVAGTTGSGKSVSVNGMIVSLLYNASPDDVRFIMVDPKMLELSIYEGIPHLLLPVVTDPKKANLALRWAVEEMERRYELLARAGVRDIASYNARIAAGAQAAGARAVASAAASVSAGIREAQAGQAGLASASGKKRLKVMIAGPDGTEQELSIDPDDASSTASAALAPALSGGIVGEPMDPEEVSARAAAAASPRGAAAGGATGMDKDKEREPRRLPYIVIVIDEFADLMMVAPKDVETSVARIAQKARAAGLHLILATQRPSVDVITGLIKANFPSRIALQVASKIDSRTILDQPGADTLLGNGDMLFSDRGLKLRRVHGAFLSDDEVHRVVEHLKTQAKPVYDMDILKPRDEDADDGGGPGDDLHDDLYDQAVAIVCETRQASVSYIQRRLQIGYNRSARLVEQMERDGIVGPANGAKPREILAPPGDYLLQAG